MSAIDHKDLSNGNMDKQQYFESKQPPPPLPQDCYIFCYSWLEKNCRLKRGNILPLIKPKKTN